MTDVAIYACALLAMTVYAPTHCLVHLASHTAHLWDIAVAGNTFNPGTDMWLMSEEHVSRLLHPVDTSPLGFGALLEDGGQLLHLGAISLGAFVACHACGEAWNCGMSGFICVFVAEDAFELRAFFFGEVLPVIEFNRLNWSPATGKYSHEQ